MNEGQRGWRQCKNTKYTGDMNEKVIHMNYNQELYRKKHTGISL